MKRFAAILGLFAALSLGGCGGGLYIGWGDYGDTIAPSIWQEVSLSAMVLAVSAG